MIYRDITQSQSDLNHLVLILTADEFEGINPGWFKLDTRSVRKINVTDSRYLYM